MKLANILYDLHNTKLPTNLKDRLVSFNIDRGKEGISSFYHKVNMINHHLNLRKK